jgi:hypothetical protein
MALSDDHRERLVAAVNDAQSRRAAGERFRGHINRNPDYRVLQDEAAMECAAARPSLTIFGVVVGKSEAAR